MASNEPEIDPKLVDQQQETTNVKKNAKAKKLKEKSKSSCSAAPNFGYIFAYLVSISMIVVGAVYFDHKHCPAEKIALLLIIGGIFSIVGSLASQVAYRRTSIEPSNNVELKKMKEVRSETTEMSSSGQVVKVTTTTIVIVEQPPDTGFVATSTTEGADGHEVVERISPLIFALRILATLLDLAVFCVFIATSVLVFRLYPNVEYANKGDANNYCTQGLFMFAFIYLLVIYSLMLLLIFIFCCLCCLYCTFNIAA